MKLIGLFGIRVETGITQIRIGLEEAMKEDQKYNEGKPNLEYQGPASKKYKQNLRRTEKYKRGIGLV